MIEHKSAPERPVRKKKRKRIVEDDTVVVRKRKKKRKAVPEEPEPVVARKKKRFKPKEPPPPPPVPAVTETHQDMFVDDLPNGEPLSVRALRARQVACLIYQGYTFTEAADELGIAPSTVSKIFHGEDCQLIIERFKNSHLHYMQSQLEDVMPDVAKRLREDLKDPDSPHKYTAMKYFFKLYGLDQPKKTDKSGASTYTDALKALVGGAPKALPPADDEDDDSDDAIDADFVKLDSDEEE